VVIPYARFGHFLFAGDLQCRLIAKDSERADQLTPADPVLPGLYSVLFKPDNLAGRSIPERDAALDGRVLVELPARGV